MDLSRMKKHIGQLKNTGVRCVVVYRTVPDDPSSCLIVETDRLPDMYHDNVMECVNSPEAQKTNNFYDILNRRTFADGQNALQALHYKGFLRKAQVAQVTLLPFPGHELPLAMLNAQLDGTMDQYAAEAKVAEEAKVDAARKSNPMSDPNDPAAIAQGLLLQAELLDAEAEVKRNEAYAIAPELKPSTKAAPKTRGRPKLSPEEKAIKDEERKVKRRERDRERAAEKREAKKIADQQAKIDAKILRDAERLD